MNFAMNFWAGRSGREKLRYINNTIGEGDLVSRGDMLMFVGGCDIFGIGNKKPSK